tara:strand:+ start:1466 stop:3565 length:2100 start_codon:yes stop_codon:yes gene_type:complete
MKIFFTVLFALAQSTSCLQSQDTQSMAKNPNRLINETSPYLLQHAYNPVDWYPWGDEAFVKAKAENKLVIVSIGYSSCHWCHVMEHESFEDDSASFVMNKRYINIKVDREERPDVDQIYMNAIQLMTGRGGWPLNCIILPDGRPIWGGTYFKRDKWIDQINTIADFYATQPYKTNEYAEKLTQGIQQSELISMNEDTPDFSSTPLDNAYEVWAEHFDTIEGGPDRAPKFPIPNNYQFLLRYAHLDNNKEALQHVKLTLDKIAFGGIYDHLGGGITRYSTDNLWKVPHFEKMLYDNGQIVSLYCEAFQKFKDDNYKNLVFGTLEFIERELMSPEFAFYSALDADSDGEEGKFYIWRKEELMSLLGDNYFLFADYYNVNEIGYWEHDHYILMRTESESSIAERYQLDINELKKRIVDSQKKLMAARADRIRPGLDDKSLTSWNGLMLKAYVDAYLTFGEEHFLDIALKNANFILDKQLREGGALNHSYKEGRSTINGYLEDYAFVIAAFLKLYEATFDSKWLMEADALTDYCLVHFYDDNSGMFYFTSDQDDKLIARKMEVTDNVIPASNSVMANNMFLLSRHFLQEDYKEKSLQMLNNVMGNWNNYPSGYSNWMNLLLSQVYPFYEVAISGKKSPEKALALFSEYIPNKVLSGSKKASVLPLLENRFIKGQTRIFVCKNKVCQLPFQEVEQAIKLMNKDL